MNKYGEKKSIKDLESALSESKKYGEQGHKIANDAICLLQKTVDSVSKKLEKNIKDLNNSNINERKVSKDLILQLDSIKENFEKLPYQLREDIKEISKSTFSITLFGRTMAGKSTLMEILTNGDGNSIGKGAQRTTRDVRSYLYKGMMITDVPGIAAFDGEEDEVIAFEAAKKSDLILFLITDDAPQASEAECLNKILKLGKPVICIVNVKANIDQKTNFKMFERDIKKKMDINRLKAIKEQFIIFGEGYGQNWKSINFAYVHLKSMYISKQDETNSNKLYELSHFNYLENLISNIVIKNGCFYKLKSFSDSVIIPSIDTFEMLFQQGAQNREQSIILKEKKQKLERWINNFKIDSKKRIKSFSMAIGGELKKEISSFAEENYKNSNAGKNWDGIVKSQNIEKKAIKLLKELGEECEDELQEICREINSELKFSHAIFSDNSINMPHLFEEKRVWNWATKIVGGGLTIAGLFMSAPITWVGLAVGLIGWLGSFFFDDQEAKIRDARRALEKKLIAYVEKMITDIEKKMLDILEKELIKKQLKGTLQEIDEIIISIDTLARTQRDFAKILNGKFSDMNRTIITEALVYIGFSGLEYHITRVVRIPGNAIMLVLEDGTVFPNEAKRELSNILKEDVMFIFNTKNLMSILLQAIGKKCDRDMIEIQYTDDEPQVAHIPNLEDLDAVTCNRIRLAQQLTELLIMK